MKPQKITIEYYRFYLVTFPEGEEGERVKKAGYFVSETEAKKIANLKKGCWGAKGIVKTEDFPHDESFPDYFTSADDWAVNNLTVVEYKKYRDGTI